MKAYCRKCDDELTNPRLLASEEISKMWHGWAYDEPRKYVIIHDCLVDIAQKQDTKSVKAIIPDNNAVVGVAYRFYPGGVECEITEQTEVGFEESTGWAKAKIPEKYDRYDLVTIALRDALKRGIDEQSKKI